MDQLLHLLIVATSAAAASVATISAEALPAPSAWVWDLKKEVLLAGK
jgi:hypothetical protein